MRGALEVWALLAGVIARAIFLGIVLVGPGLGASLLFDEPLFVLAWVFPAMIVFVTWATWDRSDDDEGES